MTILSCDMAFLYINQYNYNIAAVSACHGNFQALYTNVMYPILKIFSFSVNYFCLHQTNTCCPKRSVIPMQIAIRSVCTKSSTFQFISILLFAGIHMLERRSSCYQLIGIDLLVSSDGRVRFIESNSYPLLDRGGWITDFSVKLVVC